MQSGAIVRQVCLVFGVLVEAQVGPGYFEALRCVFTSCVEHKKLRLCVIRVVQYEGFAAPCMPPSGVVRVVVYRSVWDCIECRKCCGVCFPSIDTVHRVFLFLVGCTHTPPVLQCLVYTTILMYTRFFGTYNSAVHTTILGMPRL